MSKPWEESWKIAPYDGGVIVDVNDAHFVAESRPGFAEFIAAAPDMARALKKLTDAAEAVRMLGENELRRLDSALGDAYDAMTKGGMPIE